MDNQEDIDLSDIFSPAFDVDYSSFGADEDNIPNTVSLPGDKVPSAVHENRAPERSPAKGNIKKVINTLESIAKEYGVATSENMKELFKYYCVNDTITERDITFFIRGYNHSNSSNLGPKLENYSIMIKEEITLLQQQNSRLRDTIKELLAQADAVQKEIKQSTINIGDVIKAASENAIKSAVTIPPIEPITIVTRQLDKMDIKTEPATAPNEIQEVTQLGHSKEAEVTKEFDRKIVDEMISTMIYLGVDESLLNAVPNSDIPQIYPMSLIKEYDDIIDEDQVQILIRGIIEANIDKLFSE